MKDTLHGIKVEQKLKAHKNLLGEHKRVNSANFKGYAGLTHTAKEICEFIPKCKIFVEPFAGLGRISKHVLSEKYILNDLSDYAIRYLTKHFTHHEITQEDYLKCIMSNNSKDAFIFQDPPWFDNIYEDNPLTAYTKPNKEIYNELEILLPTLKADWMIAGRTEGILSKWDKVNFYHKEIKSKKNYLFGHKARTYLVSNKPFTNYHQQSLFSFGEE